jgi:phosphoribosyl-AMP cyclohydrolase
MRAEEVKFSKDGLIPAIITEAGEVLMLAYMNEESLKLTLETKETHFFSRSRSEIWHKGASSGNRQIVKSIRADCDVDTLLIEVQTLGPACHTGLRSCFDNHDPVVRDD